MQKGLNRRTSYLKPVLSYFKMSGSRNNHHTGRWSHLVEESLIVHGLAAGAHVGLAERDLLADVTLAVARQLGFLHAVRVAGVQPPLALAFPPPLLPARSTNTQRASRGCVVQRDSGKITVHCSAEQRVATASLSHVDCTLANQTCWESCSLPPPSIDHRSRCAAESSWLQNSDMRLPRRPLMTDQAIAEPSCVGSRRGKSLLRMTED